MIRFTGKKLREKDQEILIDVAKFTLAKFVKPSKLKNVTINVRLETDYTRGWSGECADQGVDEFTGRRKFDIVIRITKINHRAKDVLKRLKDPMKTIIHEMVHVKQYVNREMRDFDNGDTKFQGKTIIAEKQCNYYEYWDLPWEVEAYGHQEGTYEQYCMYHKEFVRGRKKRNKRKK